jgi:TetR/AcrR family transcriptional repressor of nem operon
MPYTKEHRARTREKILDSAGRLFSRNGYEAVSIDDLMNDAGLTRGAFYNYFASKSDVYAAAIVHTALNSPLSKERVDGTSRPAWFMNILNGYLNREHVEDKPSPCPLAFLVTDVANRDPAVRSTYTRVYTNLLALFESQLTDFDSRDKRETAMAVTVMMIGGVALGRALDNSALTEELLESCRNTAKNLLDLGTP